TVSYLTFSEALEKEGVIFTDIFTAMEEHSDLVKKYYMKDAVAVDENRLTALHAALMNSGVFIYVPENVKIEKPLQTFFWQEDAASALFNHVLIVAEAGSSVTYVENYLSNNEDVETVSNVVAEVFAGDHAEVSYG